MFRTARAVRIAKIGLLSSRGSARSRHAFVEWDAMSIIAIIFSIFVCYCEVGLFRTCFFLKPFLPNISVHAAAVAMVEMEASLGRVSNESRDSAATQPRLIGATHQQPLQLHTQKNEEAMCNASVLLSHVRRACAETNVGSSAEIAPI